MKKIILIILVVLVVMGCRMEPDLGDWEYEFPPDDGRNSFLWTEDFGELLNIISTENTIDRVVIAAAIESLATDKGEYSIFVSGSSVCHTFHWDSYYTSEHRWIYYITVDIWVVNGVLDLNRCSYYSN